MSCRVSLLKIVMYFLLNQGWLFVTRSWTSLSNWRAVRNNGTRTSLKSCQTFAVSPPRANTMAGMACLEVHFGAGCEVFRDLTVTFLIQGRFFRDWARILHSSPSEVCVCGTYMTVDDWPMVRASPHNSQMSKRELERSQTVEFGGGVHLVYGAEPVSQ